ncbi:golgin subfamily A member 4-like isoform X3 [Biomphalaria glabrata]|uniref:Golgin subfamily A member 4-like isoform X3 n=1 Tax=Biomphalaria glabrata TaxID=6526 RepID=A0A9W2Z7N3_BIOGL|nr:golgin subfamily A member 4-like isoform X3 [Biomphalaria glabrata]
MTEPNILYQMQQKVVEMIEEIKLLRKWNSEKEHKIDELHMKNFNLQKSLEEENAKFRASQEDLESQFSRLTLQYEEKIKTVQLDLFQANMKKGCKDYVEKKLQDALSDAQLQNYRASKTIQELNDKIKSMEKAVDTFNLHLANVGKLQGKWQDTLMKAEKSIGRLESKVEQAIEDNSELRQIARHLDCIVKVKTQEILALRQDLLQVNVKVKVDPKQDILDSKEREIKTLNLRVESLERQISELMEDLAKRSKRTKELKLQNTLSALTDQITLIEKEKLLLEESNYNSTCKVEELSELLCNAQRILNVTKVDFGQQYGQSFQISSDLMIQVSPEVSTKITQTSQGLQFDKESQTFFRLPSASVQTESPFITSAYFYPQNTVIYDSDTKLQSPHVSQSEENKKEDLQRCTNVSNVKHNSSSIPCKQVYPFSIKQTAEHLYGHSSLTSTCPVSHFEFQSGQGLCKSRGTSKTRNLATKKIVTSKCILKPEDTNFYDKATSIHGQQLLPEKSPNHPSSGKRQKMSSKDHRLQKAGSQAGPLKVVNYTLKDLKTHFLSLEEEECTHKIENIKGIIKDRAENYECKTVTKKSVQFPEQLTTICQGLTPTSQNESITSKTTADHDISLNTYSDYVELDGVKSTVHSPHLFTASVQESPEIQYCEDDLKAETANDSWTSDMTADDIVMLL